MAYDVYNSAGRKLDSFELREQAIARLTDWEQAACVICGSQVVAAKDGFVFVAEEQSIEAK